MRAQVKVSGLGKGAAGRKTESGAGWQRIGGAGFLHDVVRAVHVVMPRAAVPVIVAGEVEHAGAFHVERHVVVVGQLIEEMGGVGPLVAASPVVGAAHVGARADALIRPAVPHAVRIQTHGNDGLCRAGHGHEERQDTDSHWRAV